MKFIYIHLLTKSTHTAVSVPRQPHDEDKEERCVLFILGTNANEDMRAPEI
jgi:hypothetical protein